MIPQPAPEAIIEAAFKSPKLHPKKSPNLETAMRVVGDTAKKQTIALLKSELLTTLKDAILPIEINAPVEYKDITDPDARYEYEAAMDDAVEASLSPYEQFLSADWLGKNTIDTGVWNSEFGDRAIVEALALSAAKEVFKQYTFDRTPNQWLAELGVLQHEVSAQLQTETTTTTEKDTPAMENIVNKMQDHLGPEPDPLQTFEDLELICTETDDILRGAAAGRLGLALDEADTLATAALDHADAPQFLYDTLTAEPVPEPVPAPAPTPEPAPAPASVGGTGPVSEQVFEALKLCGAKDTTTAERLGVSRSTYTNYVKGKAQLEPDADQYKVLRDELTTRANALLTALSNLDGVPAQVVV